MKKNCRALLTAAMFASSIGMLAPAPANSGLLQAPTMVGAYDPATDIPQPAYGPPETETTTTSSTEETTTTCIPQAAYGPPSMFYPGGDVNMDKQLDGRDLSALLTGIQKKDIWTMNLGDLNKDGVTDATDLALLSDFLAGKITHCNYSVYPVTSTETTTTETTTTTTETTVTDSTDEPLTDTTLDSFLTTTTTILSTVYGPPMVI